jgi:hypothetical protein
MKRIGRCGYFAESGCAAALAVQAAVVAMSDVTTHFVSMERPPPDAPTIAQGRNLG